MKLEIFKSSYGYYNLRTIDSRPTEEMVNYLKESGYRWSRNNNAWYPATIEAKNKEKNRQFVNDFHKRFFAPATQEQKSFGQELIEREQRKQAYRDAHGLNQNKKNNESGMHELEEIIDNSLEYQANETVVKTLAEDIAKKIVEEKTAQLEALISELRDERRKDQEKIAKLEFELANSRDEGLSYALDIQEEQQEIDEEAEWERENALTEEKEQKIIESSKTAEKEKPAEQISGETVINSSQMNKLAAIMDDLAKEEEPEAERDFKKAQEKNEVADVEVSPEEISIAKAVLPTSQYVTTLRYSNGEEGNFFKQKIKDIAEVVKNAPKIYQTNGAEQHPIVLRYFHPTGTETLVTEIGKDGEAYGFQCLNGDYQMAEWGYIDLNEVKNIRMMEIDYHVEKGMTVERWLYKNHPEIYPEYAKFLEQDELLPTYEEIINRVRHKDGYVLTKSGSKDFGEITPEVAAEIHHESGKIRLEVGSDDNGRGYGEAHIERAERLKQLEQNGFDNARDFIEYVSDNFDAIYEGRNNTLIIVKRDEKANLAYLSLKQNEIDREVFYTVESSLISRTNYLKENKLLWTNPNSSYKKEQERAQTNHLNETPSAISGNSLDNLNLSQNNDSVNKKTPLDIAKETGNDVEAISEALKNENAVSEQEKENKPYNFFINDAANLDLGIGAEIEPITGLSAEKAAIRYGDMKDMGLNPYIGLNIPGDFIFDDKYGEGAAIFTETNGRPSFYIGDNFVKELKENNEHAQNVLAAYKELYEMTDKYVMNVEKPEFVFDKENELFENIPSNDKEYAENLADWIVQYAMNESTEMENHSVSYEDILENTETSEEWLNAHIDLINDALAAHNDNELLDYNPDENEGKEFNLYFCSNSDEMGENTLFKQNEEGRWVRKSEEELQREKQESENIEIEAENGEKMTPEQLHQWNEEQKMQHSQNSELDELAEGKKAAMESAVLESPFDRVTKEYSEKYKDFYATYDQMKEKFLENESSYIGDARIRSSFEQIHDELVKLQIQEVNDIIKESANIDEAKENAIRYFNFNGNDGLTTNNLYFATKIGSYNQGKFSTSVDKLHEYIETKFNETHVLEAEYKIMQEIVKGLSAEEIELNLKKYKESLVYAQEKSKETWEDFYARNTTGFDTPQTVVEFRSAYENNKKQFEYDVNKYTGWIKALEEKNLQNLDQWADSQEIIHSQQEVEQLKSKKDIKAIREQCKEILQKPDSEITEADKAILAQYEGAGGLNEVNRTNAGILNEFYTPNNLVDKVWQIVDAYAPNAKTVLEPSAGVGKFANNRPGNEFTMHELDETSARINKILHPEANVVQGAYQKQFFDAGERLKLIDYQQPKYDVVIGNPPYGKYNDKYKGLGEGKEFDRYEEYFIAKGLEALKDENSIMAFVVPSGFLNTASDKQKEIIASKGKLIDAYRLPVGTFPTTEVGTDIIIMQSWNKSERELLNGEPDLWQAQEILSNGNWFKQHPEKILGEVKTRTNRFGKEEEYVVVHEGLTVQDELKKIDSMLPKIDRQVSVESFKLSPERQKHFDDNLDWLVNTHGCEREATAEVLLKLYVKFPAQNGEAFERSKVLPITFGNLRYKENESSDSLDFSEPYEVSREELESVIGIFDDKLDYHTVWDRAWAIRHGMSKEDVSRLIEWDYSKLGNHKFKTEQNTQEINKESAQDQHSLTQTDNKEQAPKVKSPRAKKEKWNITKSKGEVMTAEEFAHLYGRDFDEREFPIWAATDWQGIIDLEKLSTSDIQYMHESGNYVQKNVGEWTHKVLFTTGDIYAKIEEQKELRIKEIARNGENSEMAKDFAKNIELLESSKKASLDIEHIHFGLKSTLAEEFTIPMYDGENMVDVNLQEAFILWAKNETLANTSTWRGGIEYATANITREELGEGINFNDIVDYIDGKPVKAQAVRGWRTYDMSEEEKKAEKSERKKEADLKRQARADVANKLFDRYIHEGLELETIKRLEAEYNRRFNSYIIPDYSKLPLFVDGMSAYKGDSKFKLYDQQIKGISFLCNKGNGLLAYDVGVGKTAAGIVATKNQIQTERSQRPLIVVPNQVYSKWYTDIKQLFPNVQVNDLYNFNKDSVGKYVDSENPHKLNIPVNSISLCTYEALKNITFTDESCENELYQDFANLLSADMDGSERENAQDSDKIKGIIGAASHVNDASYYFFEDCGFDHITVDEAHNFKNLWVVPRPKKKGESNEYSGIPSGKPSARALKLYGMTQLVQRHNDDRNVFLLTATPFTNSPTEVYSMLSYIGRERLQRAGITSLRSFFDQFAQTKQEFAVTSKGEIDTKQVMKNWKELPALQNILTEFIDKVDGEEAGIVRPNKFTHVKPLDMSELQQLMRKMDEERMAEIKEGNSAAVIVAMNNMRLSCVAPALANPDMYEGLELPPLNQLVETSPKLKFVCDAIIDMYKENPEKGQFMYVPLGKESHGIIKDYLVQHGIPKEAVEIINGEVNNTPEKKEKITAKFNNEKDKCKIIIGGRNTAEGIDLNGNSFVMYNCSLGWNPSETIQAEGRIWRQGNLQGHVHIVYPVMNDSIDSVLYQKHDEKRSRVNELWNYKGDSLNVEDINPEDLKLDLIKDPQKKAKLILEEETKETKAELAKIKLKIKDFDEIVERRKQLTLDFGDAKDSVKYYEEQIDDYKSRELEVPEWIKTGLKRAKKSVEKSEYQKETLNNKLYSWNIQTPEDEEAYIRNLNTQKERCEEKIKNITAQLPEILQKLEIERLEQKVMEYPVTKQREILEADILNNLRPMKEVKYEILTERHNKMLEEKLKAGDITQEEHDLFKAAGYENYEKWLNGEIESLIPEEVKKQEVTQEKVQQKVETPKVDNPPVEKPETKETIKEAVEAIPSQLKDAQQQELFDFDDWFSNPPKKNDDLVVKSSEQPYFNFGMDDIHLTPDQLTKAELKRDEIVLPILNGKESGMYKAFNDFAKRGVFDVVGTKIELAELPDGRKTITEAGFQQLHAAMNIYRDKQFETMRYVFINKDTGKIRDQLAITSCMPNLSPLSMNQANQEETFQKLIARAELTDSMIVAVHNHPSGNITASEDDIKSTHKLDEILRTESGKKLFAGHIILDHNSFNVYDPHQAEVIGDERGWATYLDSNYRYGAKDKMLNNDFAFKDISVHSPYDLPALATMINDTNNWNDNFIPVCFANADQKITGVKLYDQSFFNKEADVIRNEFQFAGIEAGAIWAFPVFTEAYRAKLNGADRMLLDEKLKNLIKSNAFTDAVVPVVDTGISGTSISGTISQICNIEPGQPFFTQADMYMRKPEVHSTWQTKVHPSLIEQARMGTLKVIQEDEEQKFQPQPHLRKAVGMGY